MNGTVLKNARRERGWTQQHAAAVLGVTQAYVSMLESGRRALPRRHARRLVSRLRLAPTALPLTAEAAPASAPSEVVRDELAALGYPGFAYLRRSGAAKHNPAQVLLTGLSAPELDRRVAEGLPWLVYAFAELDRDWLNGNAKMRDCQNRLGFTLVVAAGVARRAGDEPRAQSLEQWERELEASLLAKEGTYCHETMTAAERAWLRERRPPEARKWNLLTDLTAEQLAHAAG